jgi:L-fuculose-phosphate aldolase
MLVPSGEIPLHFNLQKKISDNNVRVVTHLHPTYTVAAMHAGIELSELVNSFPELRRYTSVARNVGEVPPISEELGRACCDSLGLDHDGNLRYNIVGIKGHGVVSVGSSPWEAFEHIERLEHICKIVLVSGNY